MKITNKKSSANKSKVALITGGSRGIGKAISLQLVKDGYSDIIINYVQDDNSAKSTEIEIKNTGCNCIIIKSNLAYPEEIDRLFNIIKKNYNHLDTLVHSAAFGAFKPLYKIKPNQWDLTMNINTRSFLICVQHAITMMNKGVIIAISSLGSSFAIPNYGVIGVSKAALEAVVRQLAMELAHTGIRINGVSGGFVETESISKFPNDDKLKYNAINNTPVGRLGKPQDIANIVSLLISDQAEWMQGQTIIADGGFSLS